MSEGLADLFGGSLSPTGNIYGRGSISKPAEGVTVHNTSFNGDVGAKYTPKSNEWSASAGLAGSVYDNLIKFSRDNQAMGAPKQLHNTGGGVTGVNLGAETPYGNFDANVGVNRNSGNFRVNYQKDF